MKRLKKRIFAGAVCEQIVFNVSDRTVNIRQAKPRPRFKNEKERQLHRTLISRRNHARRFHANFSTTSLYSTLTFDDENEIFTFSEGRQLRDLFFRKLKRKYPDAVIFIYMGRGKATHRIHFHMVTEGIPKEFIQEKWTYGSVIRISNLRAHNYYDKKDHGKDYTGLANYLFDHWTPEQGGHRWKMSKNARKAEVENTQEVKRDYTVEKPPRAPKGYILVEAQANQYGYLYFKYIVAPEPVTRKRQQQTGPPAG